MLVAIIVIVALYLKEEKDEFQRELFIQTVLWARLEPWRSRCSGALFTCSRMCRRLMAYRVFALFWVLVGLSSVPLHFYYRGGGDD